MRSVCIFVGLQIVGASDWQQRRGNSAAPVNVSGGPQRDPITGRFVPSTQGTSGNVVATQRASPPPAARGRARLSDHNAAG